MAAEQNTQMAERIAREVKGKKPEEVQDLLLDNCKATAISGLTDQFTSLTTLSLINVGLTTLDGLPKLPSLRTIDLSDNKLSGGLDKLAESCPRLYHINLCANKITDIETLAPLKNLEELAALDLFDCAVTESPDYRPSVFRLIPHLKYLDGFDVNDVEADLSEEEDDVAEDVGDEDLGSDDEEAFDSGEDELAYLNSSKAIQDEDDSADYAGSEGGIPATNGEKKNGGSSTVSSTAATAGSDAGNNRKRKLEEAAGGEKAEGEPEAKV